jgi:Subtilisin inhibitor-like
VPEAARPEYPERMRGIAFLALLGVVLAASISAAAQGPGRTAVTVTYWANGPDAGKPVVWTVRCDPAGGTHPRPLVSCRRLETGGWQLFRPTPKNVACTEIYGGPQVARVVGTVAGRRIWVTFSRQDGCAIDRWSRISPWLVPPGGVT